MKEELDLDVKGEWVAARKHKGRFLITQAMPTYRQAYEELDRIERIEEERAKES